MGLLLSKIRRIKTIFSDLRRTPARILILGLDASGKTTVLYRLKLNETVNTMPTIGCNVEAVTSKNFTLTTWDVGGQEKIRPLWKYYYSGTEGVIFVVDSSDVSRMVEVKEELFGMFDSEELAGVPVVILANKQDLPGAMKANQMMKELGLLNYSRNPWHIQETCAKTGDGLYEGIESLVNMIKECKEKSLPT